LSGKDYSIIRESGIDFSVFLPIVLYPNISAARDETQTARRS
jgi:hypothetical protein